jgi:hypothetical protein
MYINNSKSTHGTSVPLQLDILRRSAHETHAEEDNSALLEHKLALRRESFRLGDKALRTRAINRNPEASRRADYLHSTSGRTGEEPLCFPVLTARRKRQKLEGMRHGVCN